MMRLRTLLMGVTLTALSYLAISWWRTPSKPRARRGRKQPHEWEPIEKKKRKMSEDVGVTETISTETNDIETTNNTTIVPTSTNTSTIPPTHPHPPTENPIFYDLLKLYAGVDQPTNSITSSSSSSSSTSSSSSSNARGTSISESIVTMAPLAPASSRRSPIPPISLPSHRSDRRVPISLSDGDTSLYSSDDMHVHADGEESTDESDVTPMRLSRIRRVRRTRVVSPRRTRGMTTTSATITSNLTSARHIRKSSFIRSTSQVRT